MSQDNNIFNNPNIKPYLRKEAFNIVNAIGLAALGAVNTTAGKLADLSQEALKSLVGAAKTAIAVGVPATAVTALIAAHKIATPSAVADNAHLYAANAVEQSSLAKSLKDLEHMRLRKSLESTNKFHDQYI